MIAAVGGRRLLLTTLLTVLLLSAIAVTAQQRDARVAPAGAGTISGAVLSADPNPQPVRRVVVSISGGDMESPRSVITGDDGRFVFGRLPAGSYSVVARKAAYLPAEFGSMRPRRPGSRITLAAGETREIALTMFKGAAVGGTLVDADGAPVPGVTVIAMDARAAAAATTLGGRSGGTPVSSQGSGVTDDRGRFRVFGLMPGEYVLMASPLPDGSGEIGAASAAEVDAALAALAQRPIGAGRAGAPGARPATVPAPRSVGYAPTYFPGTAMFSEAQRLRLEAGENREGLNFAVTHVLVASIEGVVSGPVPSLNAVQLAIIPDTPRISGIFGTAAITSKPPDADGNFAYGNLAPGRYRVVARARAGGEPQGPAGGTPLATGRGGISGGGTPPPGFLTAAAGDMLFAVADVEVRGQDVKGVSLPLRPGGTIAGRVVFDAASAPLPDDLRAFRIQASMLGGSYVSQRGDTRVGTALSSIPPVAVNADGTFLISGLGPASYALNVSVPQDATSVWKQRTAIVDGRDLFDEVLEGPNISLRDVVVTLSDKRTEIAGTLQSASGQPASEYFVVAISANQAHWTPGSRRLQSGRPDTNGRYVFSDLPAGEYVIAALTDLDPVEWQDATFLEQIAPAGVRVTIREGERVRQDLRIK
jgi:hypothetical protein